MNPIEPIIGKYEFNSLAQFQGKYDALFNEDENGNKIPSFKFSKPVFPRSVLQKAEYDEQGNITKEQVLSDKILVDMAWFMPNEYDEDNNIIEKKHPYGWKKYAVTITEGQGLHTFLQIDYQTHKIK
jgi:hypothetical protein